MIQDFSLIIKSAFSSQNFSFFNQPVSGMIGEVESYCLNSINLSSVHTHNDSECRSSNLVYFNSYRRHYIYFRGTVHDEMITIPVMYCRNDTHFHAVLPNSFLVPHSSFSLFFILQVLSTKFFASFTVERICSIFQISVSTLYRWTSRYNTYLRVFTSLRNRYHMHFFIHLIYDFHDIIHDIFDINLHTLFQYDRKLFNRSS